jgi:hypothetical protein
MTKRVRIFGGVPLTIMFRNVYLLRPIGRAMMICPATPLSYLIGRFGPKNNPFIRIVGVP